jgi:hypothetical protein
MGRHREQQGAPGPGVGKGTKKAAGATIAAALAESTARPTRMSLPIFTDMLAAARVTAENRPRQTASSVALKVDFPDSDQTAGASSRLLQPACERNSRAGPPFRLDSFSG